MINALLWVARYWAWLALMTLLAILSLVYFSVRTISTEKKNITIESVDIRLAQSVTESANKASRALISVAHRITEYAKPSPPLETTRLPIGLPTAADQAPTQAKRRFRPTTLWMPPATAKSSAMAYACG